MKSAIIILSVCICLVSTYPHDEKRAAKNKKTGKTIDAVIDKTTNMKGSEVPSDGKDCNSACISLRYGSGLVEGAGPICASTCKNCPAGSTCIGNWDEGAWCMVGHKVCCCLKAKKVTRKLDIYNELLGRDSFNSRNNEDSNDQSDE